MGRTRARSERRAAVSRRPPRPARDAGRPSSSTATPGTVPARWSLSSRPGCQREGPRSHDLTPARCHRSVSLSSLLISKCRTCLDVIVGACGGKQHRACRLRAVRGPLGACPPRVSGDCCVDRPGELGTAWGRQNILVPQFAGASPGPVLKTGLSGNAQGFVNPAELTLSGSSRSAYWHSEETRLSATALATRLVTGA